MSPPMPTLKYHTKPCLCYKSSNLPFTHCNHYPIYSSHLKQLRDTKAICLWNEQISFNQRFWFPSHSLSCAPSAHCAHHYHLHIRSLFLHRMRPYLHCILHPLPLHNPWKTTQFSHLSDGLIETLFCKSMHNVYPLHPTPFIIQHHPTDLTGSRSPLSALILSQ